MPLNRTLVLPSDEGIDLDKEVKRTELMIGIAKTLIESGRAETEFIKTAAEFGKQDSDFFESTRSVNGKKIELSGLSPVVRKDL